MYAICVNILHKVLPGENRAGKHARSVISIQLRMPIEAQATVCAHTRTCTQLGTGGLVPAAVMVGITTFILEELVE